MRLALFLALVLVSSAFAEERCVTLSAESEVHLATVATARGETPAETWTWHTNALPDQFANMARETRAQALDHVDANVLADAIKAMADEQRAKRPSER
jgi:hypothetical protein